MKAVLTAESSSGLDTYDVVIEFSGAIFTMTCSCAAGEMGQMCRHRTGVLDGDIGVLVSGADRNAFLAVQEWISLSNVKARRAEMARALAEVAMKKKDLDRETREIKATFARRLAEGL